MFLPKLLFLLSISPPTVLITYSIPILKYLLEASLLAIQISKMILSIITIWIWEIVINTEIIDAISIILSVYILMKVVLDMCSYAGIPKQNTRKMWILHKKLKKLKKFPENE